jgi:hypothetical protein
MPNSARYARNLHHPTEVCFSPLTVYSISETWFAVKARGNNSTLMSENEQAKKSDPQSEGTGMQHEADRLKKGADQTSEAKDAAREASQGDEKAS